MVLVLRGRGGRVGLVLQKRGDRDGLVSERGDGRDSLAQHKEGWRLPVSPVPSALHLLWNGANSLPLVCAQL